MLSEQIKARRSVRSFEGIPDEKTRAELEAFLRDVPNPWGIPVEFRFLDAKKHGLICPVASGAELYVGGKVKNVPDANLAFGYSFEVFVLYAQSLGLGTVWLGGTMNRPAFERAMELAGDEMMPCASPLGYPAEKMSLREQLMRKGVKADERLPFEELFFDGAADSPLSRETAGEMAFLLDMVRLAPSAVNKQPWRVVLANDMAHFYLKRSKGFDHGEGLDMQMIDMGIALCHFEMAAKEKNLCCEFLRNDPHLPFAEGEYIASYRIG